jgi:hypothetical protein
MAVNGCWMNDWLEVDAYMGPVLQRYGFVSDGATGNVDYGDLPAWSVFYRRDDCKLQVCWSAREGGVDLLLAPVDAPNEFGLVNASKNWHFLLLLSDFDDGLTTPALDAGADVWWEWRRALFNAHFPAAHRAMVARE